MKIMAYL